MVRQAVIDLAMTGRAIKIIISKRVILMDLIFLKIKMGQETSYTSLPIH